MAEPADRVGHLFAPFHDDPARAGLFTDFDGTLSAFVDDPATAVPVAGAMEALAAVAARLGVVWVVSGRPVSFLRSLTPPGVQISGLYGLESSVGGVVTEHPDAGRWRATITEVATRAEAELAGVGVEPKGVALTLHYRGRASVEDSVRAYAAEQAARTGLVVHDAKMSVELRPPIRADKGTVLEGAATGLAAACFIGDDRGDISAFDALDRLAARGVATVRVAVGSPEAPAELLARADIVADGPTAVVGLLRSLAG